MRVLTSRRVVIDAAHRMGARRGGPALRRGGPPPRRAAAARLRHRDDGLLPRSRGARRRGGVRWPLERPAQQGPQGAGARRGAHPDPSRRTAPLTSYKAGQERCCVSVVAYLEKHFSAAGYLHRLAIVSVHAVNSVIPARRHRLVAVRLNSYGIPPAVIVFVKPSRLRAGSVHHETRRFGTQGRHRDTRFPRDGAFRPHGVLLWRVVVVKTYDLAFNAHKRHISASGTACAGEPSVSAPVAAPIVMAIEAAKTRSLRINSPRSLARPVGSDTTK